MSDEIKTVVVTGFEPFAFHKVNASWEAVKLLPDLNLEEEFNIRLITAEIPVAYDEVDSKIPKLWEQYKPHLVIHAGVSYFATRLTIESNANKNGYIGIDAKSIVLRNGMCSIGSEDNIKTAFDLKELETKAKELAVDLIISDNAHRYLCEYIYYTSLSIDRKRSIFLHVPLLNEEMTAIKIAQEIKIIIKLLLDQIEKLQGENNAEIDEQSIVCQQ